MPEDKETLHVFASHPSSIDDIIMINNTEFTLISIFSSLHIRRYLILVHIALCLISIGDEKFR